MKKSMLRKSYLGLLAFLLVLVRPSIQCRSASNDETIRVKRLAALCRLWGTVKYFHPYLAYRSDLGWDAALVAAIPKVGFPRGNMRYSEGRSF